MADNNLNTPVSTQSTRIDATLLPKVFSQPYMLYVIQQSKDLGSVAGKANEAGVGAYDAQVKNDEQDKTLANHGERIKAAEQEIADYGKRIYLAEKELTNHESRITGNTTEISLVSHAQQADRTDISFLQNDYISKSTTTSQNIASTLDITDSLSVNGERVIGARQNGWTASTGTANKSSFNADQNYTVGNTYSQAEIQTVISALVESRQRIKALEDMARLHGLIS